MNIMTWNILADEKYLDRKNRLKNILKFLKDNMPEIILLQEVMKKEYIFLKEMFNKIYIFSELKYIKWDANGKSGNIILIKYNLCNDVKFFYRENYIYMKCLYKHRKLIVINLHLDDIDKDKRKNQIIDIMEKINHHLCIIGGDFNENYSIHSNVFNILKQNKFNISNQKNIDNICYRGFELNKLYIDNKIKAHPPIIVKLIKKEKYI